MSHLLAHGGEGSLLSELKRRCLANAVSAGSYHPARGFEFFEVEFDLATEGLERIEEILELLFAHLRLIRQAGPLRSLHEEKKKLMALSFQYKDKENPCGYVIIFQKIFW